MPKVNKFVPKKFAYFQPLTIFSKSSILDVWMSSEYASAVQIRKRNTQHSNLQCLQFIWPLLYFLD